VYGRLPCRSVSRRATKVWRSQLLLYLSAADLPLPPVVDNGHRPTAGWQAGRGVRRFLCRAARRTRVPRREASSRPTVPRHDTRRTGRARRGDSAVHPPIGNLDGQGADGRDDGCACCRTRRVAGILRDAAARRNCSSPPTWSWTGCASTATCSRRCSGYRSLISSSAYAARVESSVIRPSPIICSNLARGNHAWHMSCSSRSRPGGPGSSSAATK